MQQSLKPATRLIADVTANLFCVLLAWSHRLVKSPEGQLRANYRLEPCSSSVGAVPITRLTAGGLVQAGSIEKSDLEINVFMLLLTYSAV